MQTAATRFSYKWSYTNPNNMQQDILEILWNFLCFIYNHHSMIHKLSRSKLYIYRNWSKQDREQAIL
jgi:hypothetical protein